MNIDLSADDSMGDNMNDDIGDDDEIAPIIGIQVDSNQFQNKNLFNQSPQVLIPNENRYVNNGPADKNPQQ